LEPLHQIWESYRGQVDFLVVYIREAHPEDGWAVNSNREQGINYLDPNTKEERLEVATACALRLKIRMPVVIDDVDDNVASAYGALPDRLYLIARGGRIAYQGAPGPWGFDPEGLRQAIEALA
jgi:hypothetical protein